MASRANARIRVMLEKQGRFSAARKIRIATNSPIRNKPELVQDAKPEQPQAIQEEPKAAVPRSARPKDIRGKAVVIMASGPSLNQHDISMVRRSGLPTITVNRTWEAVPFATIIFAGDDQWWRRYHKTINIRAEKWTCAPASAHHFKLHLLKKNGPYNSGMRAIQLGVHLGAARIILLGFDCKYQGEKRHHHDDYPKPMGNAHSVKRWPSQFQKLSKELAGRVEVINCSRDTVLTCFQRASLESVIAPYDRSISDSAVAERDHIPGIVDLHNSEVRDDEYSGCDVAGERDQKAGDPGLFGSGLLLPSRGEGVQGRIYTEPDQSGGIVLEEQAEESKGSISIETSGRGRLSNRVYVG